MWYHSVSTGKDVVVTGGSYDSSSRGGSSAKKLIGSKVPCTHILSKKVVDRNFKYLIFLFPSADSWKRRKNIIELLLVFDY